MKTVKEIAEMLDGSEYNGSFPSRDVRRMAAESKIVICYGASDDLVEFCGAFDDETGGPGNVYMCPTGLLQTKCRDDRCPHEIEAQKAAPRIRAKWNDKDGPCWTFETSMPHEIFKIMEDGEVFCEGIVFHMDSIALARP